MAQVIVTESSLQNIAGAIRSKLGTQDTYTPSEMAGAISQIHGDPVLETLSVNANGTYNPSSGKDGFSQAVVNVPNSYSSGDEGKVVSGGALVAQSSQSITQNGTYDTTLKNQAVVSVPNSYSASDEGKVVNNGALVAQSSQTITDNGTYDTTLKNQVTVNVSGGGGSNVLFGPDIPTSDIGSNGDYYIRDGVNEVIIRIDISVVARGTSTNFNYYGSRAISIVCTDEHGNEVEISPYIKAQYYWKGNSLVPSGQTSVFRATIGSYIENNGLPAHYAAKYDIPAGYSIDKFRLTRRNSSSYPDYWASFDIFQCDALGNNLSQLLSVQGLTESDWNDWDSFTDFQPSGQIINNTQHSVYQKVNGEWVAI